MSAIKLVLLDVDGTLIDSNDTHARTWVATLAEHGFPVEFEVVRSLIGMGGDDLMDELGVPQEPTRRHAIEDRRAALFLRELSSLSALAGAARLLDRLGEAGLRRVVVTSSPQEQLEAMLEQAGLIDKLDDTISADEVARAKPDPALFVRALQTVGAKASDSVALGDTPYDLEAARKAGVRLVALRSGGWEFAPSDEGCLARLTEYPRLPPVRSPASPVEIYDDPAELVRRWDKSLFVEKARST
jgi:HAD superfamily hydrolase (TIGR01509 family)